MFTVEGDFQDLNTLRKLVQLLIRAKLLSAIKDRGKLVGKAKNIGQKKMREKFNHL